MKDRALLAALFLFAFMAISMAMFGMTLGALLVFLRPAAWPEETLLPAMGRCALLFALSMVVVIFLHISLFLPSPSLDLWPLVWTFAGAAVPFVFSGIFVCLALTRFPARIAQLYAARARSLAVGGQRRHVGARFGPGGGDRHGVRNFRQFLERGCQLSIGIGRVRLRGAATRRLARYLAAGLAGASSSRFARSCARMSAV
jgi:hypothetical protein